MENTTKATSNRFAFIKALFDFKFEEFIYIKVARFLYLISVVVIGLGTAGLFLFTFWNFGRIFIETLGYPEYIDDFMSYVGWAQLLLLLVTPIAGILSIIILRLGLESGIALVAIAENTKKK
jgi:hypothetical protein